MQEVCIGLKFGFYEVISKPFLKYNKNKTRRTTMVRCRCQCGRERDINPCKIKNSGHLKCISCIHKKEPLPFIIDKENKICYIEFKDKLKLIVDVENKYLLENYRWYINRVNHCWYGITYINTKPRRLHTLIPIENNYVWDHIDGNGLNNRLDNLRKCNQHQNSLNRKKSKSAKTSKYIGVYFDKRSKKKKWKASLFYKQKCMFRKNFYTEEEAALARDDAAKKYHGEFAKLNFPEENNEK